MRQIQVSVVTPYKTSQGNRMFTNSNCLVGSHSSNVHWLEPTHFLYRKALAQGIKLDTSDLVPVEKADVALFFDLPPSAVKLLELKKRAPAVKFILLVIESPLNRAHAFHKKNHSYFDAVITYNEKLADNKHYFAYKLPLSFPSSKSLETISFEKRRVASLISTNRSIDLKTRLRYITKSIRGGWKYPVAEALADLVHSPELYSYRRKVANAFVSLGFHKELDIFGSHWDGHPCYRGILDSNKLKKLPMYRFNICVENCLNDIGYISEKIFEALYSQTVPVYMGNNSIKNYVPQDCFINAQEFKSPSDLVMFLVNCPKNRWEEYIAAGESFLKSPKLEEFLPGSYAKNILGTIRYLLQNTNTKTSY